MTTCQVRVLGGLVVLTVFLPAAGPELLHPHFIVTCPARPLARLLRDRGRNLHFAARDLLRRVDISPHQGSSRRQATSRPARLDVDPEVGRVGRLPGGGLLGVDLAALRPPGHRVLPDPVLLAAPVMAPADLVEGVLRVSLSAVRPRAEPPGRGESRVGVLAAAALLSAVERVLHCGAVQGVVVVVAGGDLQAGVGAGLVLPGLTVPVVAVVRVVAVFVSPATSIVPLLHLVVSPRHVWLVRVWCPLEAILHTFDFGRVEAERGEVRGETGLTVM